MSKKIYSIVQTLIIAIALFLASNDALPKDKSYKSLEILKSESVDTLIIIEQKQSNQTETIPEQSISESDVSEDLSFWQVISSGGIANGSWGEYYHSGAIGQTATGYGYANNLLLSHGFWQDFSSLNMSCCIVPGDANNDGTTNVGDAVFLINFVFKNGGMPDCLSQADANNDCSINIGDAVFISRYCFSKGASPECGCATESAVL